MSSITTHVLDTAAGKPAEGVPIRLESLASDQTWSLVAKGVTNADGRIQNFISADTVLENGTYRMNFETAAYLKGNGFYPYVEVVFEIKDSSQHYHIPLLLSPFGYSTYRGS
jgi:5-hydroxyisourate hydrolase